MSGTIGGSMGGGGNGTRTFKAGLETYLNQSMRTKIYPSYTPQARMLPSVSFFRVSTDSERGLKGPAGLARYRYQIDCWGETVADVETLAEQLRLCLDGYVGWMGEYWVQGVDLDTQLDDYDPPANGSPGTHRVMSQYFFSVDELVPIHDQPTEI